MERHGRLHLPALFHIQLEQYERAGADCLQQVTVLAGTMCRLTLGLHGLCASNQGLELLRQWSLCTNHQHY